MQQRSRLEQCSFNSFFTAVLPEFSEVYHRSRFEQFRLRFAIRFYQEQGVRIQRLY